MSLTVVGCEARVRCGSTSWANSRRGSSWVNRMPLVQPRVQQPQALDMVDDDDRAAVVLGQRVERAWSIADWLSSA